MCFPRFPPQKSPPSQVSAQESGGASACTLSPKMGISISAICAELTSCTPATGATGAIACARPGHGGWVGHGSNMRPTIMHLNDLKWIMLNMFFFCRSKWFFLISTTQCEVWRVNKEALSRFFAKVSYRLARIVSG